MTQATQGYISEITAVSIILDSLADDTWTALSTPIMYDADALFINFSMDLGVGVGAWAGSIGLYIIPSLNGTDYGDWSIGSTDEPANEKYYVGSITPDTETAAQVRLQLNDVALPPGNYCIGVRNTTGQALAASGNALSYRTSGLGTQ